MFGFGEEEPRPCSPEREAFGKAIFGLMKAKDRLDRAKKDGPDYTGQWDSSDYYAEQKEDWYRACDQVSEAVIAVVAAESA